MKQKEFENRNDNESNPDRFESDTQKIVRRHLENKNDVITEEDIRNVRVGLTPPPTDNEENLEEEIQNAEEKKKIQKKMLIQERILWHHGI